MSLEKVEKLKHSTKNLTRLLNRELFHEEAVLNSMESKIETLERKVKRLTESNRKNF